MNGAEVLLETLLQHGVDTVFGYPGGAIIPVYDALYGHALRHILMRHEQGAAHAATAYARASGRVGVIFATSGPGALNLVTGLADALMDSTPVVAITGNVPSGLIGTDAFQEADVTGATMPVTKHNYLVEDVNDLPRVVREAFHIAASGRPGPVLIDLPKDVQMAAFDGELEPALRLPGYQPTYKGHPRQIERALLEINQAERPVLILGGGAQGAASEVLSLAERTGLPVVTTLMGLGAFPGGHSQFLGMPGMHGTVAAGRAIHHADVIMGIGLRFDDRVTGDISRFAANARSIIHVDIDPAEIGKLVEVQVPVVGDARLVAAELADSAVRLELSAWWAQINSWRTQHPVTWRQIPELLGQEVVNAFARATEGNAIVTTGVGQHQMFVAQFFGVQNPRSFLTSGGLGTMGFGLPAAIGAQLARPAETVIDFDGDGSFQMTLQELATLKRYNLPVKIVLLNNGYLGLVRQWQDLFNEQRFSEVELASSNPDFTLLAQAYGLMGLRVEKRSELEDAVQAVLSHDGPVLAEFKVHAASGVFPMIPAGGSAEDIIIEDPRVQEKGVRV